MKGNADRRTVQLLCGVLEGDRCLERVPYVKHAWVEDFWVIDIIVVAMAVSESIRGHSERPGFISFRFRLKDTEHAPT